MKVKLVITRPSERRKIPSQTSSAARKIACNSMPRNPCPAAERAAIENGTAAPTRKEKPGWIMSCSEPPRQSTCSV